MTNFQQAIRMNNDGVQFLVNGEDEKAIPVLSEAFKSMKQHLARAHEDSITNASNEAICKSNDQLFVQLPDNNIGEADGTQTDLSLFNHAMVIPTIDEEHACGRVVVVHAAAIIFNLALAHHRKGIRTENLAVTSKALKLYTTILKLLRGGGDDDLAGSANMEFLLKLATISNLLEIQSQFGDYDLIAYERLEQLTRSLRRKDTMLLDAILCQTSGVKGQLMSVLLTKPPSVAPAA